MTPDERQEVRIFSRDNPETLIAKLHAELERVEVMLAAMLDAHPKSELIRQVGEWSCSYTVRTTDD